MQSAAKFETLAARPANRPFAMLRPVACALMVLATAAGDVASQDFLEAVAGGNLTAAERAVQDGAEVGERDRRASPVRFQ